MKLVIVGGVAAGATAAARARRVSENAEIAVFERGPYVSFANCGLPYHVSGDIPRRSDLLLQTPEGFRRRYKVDVFVDTAGMAIDRARTAAASPPTWCCSRSACGRSCDWPGRRAWRSARRGGLVVDEHMRTSDPDIYAAGDMVEFRQRISGRTARVPLAGPANRQGRIAASNALGLPTRFAGALGTSVVKVFDATAGMTGLGERAARAAGFDVGAAIVHKDHNASYYPGAAELTLKLVYDRRTTRVLGAQAFGGAGIDKRSDVIATALAGNLAASDLADLDLAYAPPYSWANDPINVAALAGLNDSSGFSPMVTAAELRDQLPDVCLLDVRSRAEYREAHLRGAASVPVDRLREHLGDIPRGRRIVAYCRSGLRSHLAVRILREHDFADVAHVTGGLVTLELAGGLAIDRGTEVAA
ncbi:MAG: FAD-dependent oxidoreductase [Candidatus Sericytochromatia bacterium]|nr:FAD-dependent oxidoreductase [Candidatus Tanganyikabacteria bacterium]